MKNKTIGVIGLGSIGSRHATNAIAMGHKVLGYDILTNKDPTDLDYLLNRSDALVVASPSDDHSFQILAAPKDKFLLVEKPIGVSRRDSTEIKAVMDHDKNKIMVGYNLRFLPCVKKAREWMPRVGKPLWANFCCSQYSEKTPYLRDGVILNWSHEIDLALYLLGPAKVLTSSTRLTDGKDDITDIILLHDNGCRSSIHLDYVTAPQKRNFNIIGEDGFIRANIVAKNVYFQGNKESHHDAGYNSSETPFEQCYVDEMKAFLERIDGKETIGCTGNEGLKVLEICLEVRRQAGL